MTLDILNIASAAFGLAGTLVIFKFGIPNRIDTGGYGGMRLEKEDQNEKKEIKKYKRLASLGLGFISVSFILQLLIGCGIESKI